MCVLVCVCVGGGGGRYGGLHFNLSHQIYTTPPISPDIFDPPTSQIGDKKFMTPPPTHTHTLNTHNLHTHTILPYFMLECPQSSLYETQRALFTGYGGDFVVSTKT